MSSAPSLRAWRWAVFAVMLTNGLAIATVLARLPGLRDHLRIDPAEVGLFIACFSAGSLLGLGFSGALLHWLGARRVFFLAQPFTAVALVAVGLAAALLGSFWLTVAAAAVLGVSIAISDVGVQVEAAANERAAKRAVLPFVHAGFSLGTVLGAALGALAEQVGIDIGIHFGAMAVIVLAVGVAAPRWVPTEHLDAGPRLDLAQRRAVWRRPRTWLLGLVVFCFGYIEGAANDWLPLGLVDERGFDPAAAALMLSAFTAAMTAGRFAGSKLVDRLGRLPVLLGSAVLAAAGLSLLLFVPEPWAAIVGTVVWGLGSSLGWPIGISAAGDDPATAASTVAAVSIIAYVSFFAGPPLVGLLANSVGILPALTVILGLTAIALIASPVVRPVNSPNSPSTTR